MDLNTKKELFSYAYVKAVASAAGYSVEVKGRAMDNAGVDLTIEMPEHPLAKCDVQVKCTASQDILDKSIIKYTLPVKNYNKLIADTILPIILIVVFVPRKTDDWLNISENKSIIKKCGYWVSLRGQPLTQNKENITIEIPRNNLFTPISLNLIMHKAAKREPL